MYNLLFGQHDTARFLLCMVFGSLVLSMVTVDVIASQPLILDDFEQLDGWTVDASDGVVASISPAAGTEGQCLKLDFDFRAGAGFVVVRREVDIELPENYRFTFELKGEAPSNNFEFKLVDPSGDNVWWVNKRDLKFPESWRTTRYKARHMQFAWGPAGNVPLRRVGAIEFAVAASSGGAGRIFIDSLTYEVLPKPQPVKAPPSVSFSSNRNDELVQNSVLPPDGALNWSPAANDAHPWLLLDFHQVRELGGLMIDWEPNKHLVNYDIEVTVDGSRWEHTQAIRGSNGGRDYVPLPDLEALQLRIKSGGAIAKNDIAIRNIQVREVDFSQDRNRLFESIATETGRGRYPAYFLKEHAPWTVVGVSGDANEALIGAHGQVEVERGGWSIEPFVRLGDALHTWADAEFSHSLLDGYIPVPSVHWKSGGVRLTITAFADGTPGASELVVSYGIHNESNQPVKGDLYLAIRPFQVLPPWQDLGMTGGAAVITSMTRKDSQILVNQNRTLKLWSAPDGFGATTFHGGDISEYVSEHRLPAAQSVEDSDGAASGAVRYAFTLEPKASKSFVVSIPLHVSSQSTSTHSGFSSNAVYSARLDAVRDEWKNRLNRVRLKLPSSLKQLEDTFRATQAYILINRDGPAIQPGSRTYERSWIRDGAVTSTALLSCGHHEAVRAFLEWYAPYQYADGKVPCVVDRRGPDPVPEHDSPGELIYALNTFYRFTDDKAFLESYITHVEKAVDYLEALRQQRLTAEYRDATGIKKACYGLVPESISHEGYSAKPMHSYWDNFFVVKGLSDAASIARELGRTDLVKKFDALHTAHRDALYTSLRRAMAHHNIAYLPGCVELGDFDATSTAIAVFPCEQLGFAPSKALQATFDRYYEFFENRKIGNADWQDYTPYEIRIVDAYIRMGQQERAHALLEFFMKDQRPRGWRHWAEVVWRDPKTPRFIGDMPHTWVGSALINSVRSMFVYECDQKLVLLAGVDEEWLKEDAGVSLENFPTYFGRLSLRARMIDDQLTVEISGSSAPPGGYQLVLPLQNSPTFVRVDGETLERVNAGSLTLDAGVRQIVVSWR